MAVEYGRREKWTRAPPSTSLWNREKKSEWTAPLRSERFCSVPWELPICKLTASKASLSVDRTETHLVHFALNSLEDWSGAAGFLKHFIHFRASSLDAAVEFIAPFLHPRLVLRFPFHPLQLAASVFIDYSLPSSLIGWASGHSGVSNGLWGRRRHLLGNGLGFGRGRRRRFSRWCLSAFKPDFRHGNNCECATSRLPDHASHLFVGGLGIHELVHAFQLQPADGSLFVVSLPDRISNVS